MSESIQVPISFPSDELQRFGRTCKICQTYFKTQIKGDLEKPEEVSIFCPYCLHEGKHVDFFTAHQEDYLSKMAQYQGAKIVQSELDQMFDRLSHETKFLKITKKPSPPSPPPHLYTDPELSESYRCDVCENNYQTIRPPSCCPSCGARSTSHSF